MSDLLSFLKIVLEHKKAANKGEDKLFCESQVKAPPYKTKEIRISDSYRPIVYEPHNTVIS